MDGATPSARDVVELALLAERRGYESVWVSDHFLYEPYEDFRVVGIELPEAYAGVQCGAWECWSLMAAIAQASSRLQIGTLVSNTGLRNPALLARQVDTVNDLCRGRLIVGLGAGDFATEHLAYGYDFERPIGRFEEALGIIVPMLRGETVSVSGEFHRTRAARIAPRSVQDDGPPIMIGALAGGPRMSRLVVQYARMWNCMLAFGSSEVTAFEQAWGPIRRACEKYDRDPATVERHATVAVNLTKSAFPIPGATPIAGSQAAIAEQIADLFSAGADILSVVPHPWTADGIEAFSEIIDLLSA